MNKWRRQIFFPNLGLENWHINDDEYGLETEVESGTILAMGMILDMEHCIILDVFNLTILSGPISFAVIS